MFLRPQHFDLVASGLPERVVWKLLRLKRATRLGNYLRRRRALLSAARRASAVFLH